MATPPHTTKPMTPKERYNQAHEQWFSVKYPNGYKDGHYTKPIWPKVQASNGLTRAIINFIIWSGGNADRCSTVGRIVDKTIKVEGGRTMQVKRMITASNRRGSADITSTIWGRSVKWEVKIGKDRPSTEQLEEQARERKAGGEYFFVHSFEEFLYYYDSLVNNTSHGQSIN